MPYIKEEDRDPLCYQDRHPETAGELNYYFTMAARLYLLNKGESYQTYNDIIGALEGCKMELYRRKISPYEDKKIEENGDVY